MKVEQIYQVVNTMSKEYLGETAVVNEDLSNIVDIGSETIKLDNLDRYVRSLIDQIGKITFVNRPYSGSTPSLYMDGWEYGAVEEKVQYDELPKAEQNETWELEDGHSYDPNIFTKPKVSAKFFSKKVTFDIAMSFAERQVKSAFQNAGQLNSFFSMIETAISNSMTLKIDQLAMSALNYMTGLTMHNNKGLTSINLLSGYKSYTGDTTMTVAKCLTSPEFIRYAAMMMDLYKSRVGRLSKLFNNGDKDRFTPADRLNIIMLADFKSASDTYLQSDTFHNEFVTLPKADIVPYWQGSGTDYGFNSVSKIDVKVNVDSVAQDVVTRSTVTVQKTGILAVMFDRYAVGVANLDRRVTANYNGRAEFFNNWYKFDCGYFDDPDENFIVFYVA